MKTLLILFFSLLSIFFTWQIYGLYSTNKTKEVGSEIIGIKKGVFFKKYKRYRKAFVDINGMSSANSKFGILANYIFGGNQDSSQIAMTSPVIYQLGSSSTFSFVMPDSWLDKTMPTPNDKDIKFETITNQYVAVIEFGGFAKEETCIKKHLEMKKVLEGLNIKTNDDFSVAVYQPPYQLLNRKNEIWIELTQDQVYSLF